jgi:hypothetical protein
MTLKVNLNRSEIGIQHYALATDFVDESAELIAAERVRGLRHGEKRNEGALKVKSKKEEGENFRGQRSAAYAPTFARGFGLAGKASIFAATT